MKKEKLANVCAERAKISREYFEEFSEKTGLDAVKYVGDPRKSILSRLFWLLAIIACLSVSFYLISVLWRKWNATPVIVSLSETPTPIWDIPFPAVTICPENKVKRTNFNFTEVFLKGNRTSKEQEIYNQLSLLCNSKFVMEEVHWRLLDSESKILFSTNYIEKFAPNISDIMTSCEWMNQKIHCEELFKPVMTDEGLCYSFNSMNAREMLRYYDKLHGEYLNGKNISSWTLEDGYKTYKKSVFGPYPRRSRKPGESGGLVVFLKADEEDMDFACRWPVAGFKALLHNPADFPRLSSNFFRVSLKRDVIATIDTNIIKSTEDVEHYPIKNRGCVFQNERSLQYFKNYTMSNCEIECIMNATMEVCNCVPFFFLGNENMSICKPFDNECIIPVTEQLMDSDTLMNVCSCYPTCHDVSYKARVSQSSLIYPEVLRHLNEKNVIRSENFGRLSIYYQDIQFITSRRSELFGYTDFLASCGGLLGLCCGFSILSAVEIAYFLSLCLWGRKKRGESK